MPTNNINIDLLKLYYNKDYTINELITLKQPTVGEVLEYGEQEYYTMVYNLTAIPSDMIAQLYSMGIDYDTISDFSLFALLSKGIEVEESKILLGDLNLKNFEVTVNESTNQIYLYDEQNDVILDEESYDKLVGYIRLVHSIVAKPEHATNKYTKMALIEEAKAKMYKQKLTINKQKPSMLLPLISTMVNSPGFKYNAKEVLDLNIYQFMDSVRRISTIVSAQALQIGCYSGNIDVSKIDKKDLDWMKDISVLERPKGTTLTVG